MIVYTPKNLNLEKMLDDYHLTDKRIPVEFYYYFLNSIITQTANNRKYTPEDFVPLQRTRLSQVINNNYIDIIKDHLYTLRIIDVNNWYRRNMPGVKGMCKSYRLTKKYVLQQVRPMVIKKTKYNKKLFKSNNRISDHTLNAIQTNPSVRKLYTDFINIGFNMKAAKKYLNQCLEKGFYVDEPKKKFTVKDYNRLYVICNNIYRKNFFFHIDETAGRLHTNVTNLNSKLRKYIIIDTENPNNKVVELDIQSCQPLLLSTVYTNIFNNLSENPINVINHIHNCNNSINQEHSKYIDLIQNKDLYQVFADKYKQITNKTISRNKSKLYFIIQVLFSKIKTKLTTYQQIFAEEFPILFQYIQGLKKQEHNALAVLLQKLEAKLMINQIPGMILNKILSIHDSYLISVSCLSQSQVIKTSIETQFNEFQLQPIINYK